MRFGWAGSHGGFEAVKSAVQAGAGSPFDGVLIGHGPRCPTATVRRDEQAPLHSNHTRFSVKFQVGRPGCRRGAFANPLWGGFCAKMAQPAGGRSFGVRKANSYHISKHPQHFVRGAGALNRQAMKPKLILLLVLVLSGVLFGCSRFMVGDRNV
jgi:hypothetical protein